MGLLTDLPILRAEPIFLLRGTVGHDCFGKTERMSSRSSGNEEADALAKAGATGGAPAGEAPEGSG
jgi:hypothetical protein